MSISCLKFLVWVDKGIKRMLTDKVYALTTTPLHRLNKATLPVVSLAKASKDSETLPVVSLAKASLSSCGKHLYRHGSNSLPVVLTQSGRRLSNRA